MRVLQAFALTILTLSILGGETGIPGLPQDKPLEKKFRWLCGPAIDKADNCYFSDSEYHQVYKLTTNGELRLVAGTGNKGYSGDGGAGTAAELNRPANLVMDKLGNLYVACEGDFTIRKISPKGVISTFAGNGQPGHPKDGDPASSSLPPLTSLTIDSKGQLYFTSINRNTVYKLASDGLLYRFAGKGTMPSTDAANGDGGKALQASVGLPCGIAAGVGDIIYIGCDSSGDRKSNARIRSVNAAGTIQTFAGVGKVGFAGDGGPALRAEFFYPNALFMDKAENLYIADVFNFTIRKIDRHGNISLVCGVPGHNTGMYPGDGKPANQSRIFGPKGMAKDSKDRLIFVDSTFIRIIDEDGRIRTLAGRH